MATIKLSVLKNTRAKDGSYKIRIGVGHKQEMRYITTPYRVYSLNNFNNGVIIKQPDAHELNIKLRNLLNDYEERLERIPYAGTLSCNELRNKLQRMQSHPSSATLNDVCKEYQQELREDGRNSYANMLDNAIRLITEFNNGDVFLSEISPKMIADFERHLRRKALSTAYIGMNMSIIRTLVNRAIKEQFVTYPIHPFAYWKRPTSEEREIDISVEDFKKIRDCKPTAKAHKVGKDLFLLSYYLGGINLIDLLSIDFNRCGGVLEYTRQKSRNTKQSDKRISFTIQPEAREILDRYVNSETGHLDFGYNFTYRNFLRYATRSIKALAKVLGVENAQRVCYYSARKSFVQHGFDLGISLETLEYCIGQSMKSNRPIFNYLKIMRRHADEAMRLIYDNLK